MEKVVLRIPPREMEQKFESILLGIGFTQSDAKTLARVFMENSLDGVYSHGVNRFPRFVQYVREGVIDLHGQPECVHRSGAVEQWHGNSGPGILNAFRGVDRAIKLAGHDGIGCVALSHTNHWMRGGTYGWRAAKAGYAYIGWTNTIANMPPWGASQVKLGNNPLVLAIPYDEEAIVLDMAMSQFSFGALEEKGRRGETLPVPGGYDTGGSLSHDPAAILASQRVLPIGFWKGAGLSLLLDILATILCDGLSVTQITAQGNESNLSQVFIAIKVDGLRNSAAINSVIGGIIADFHQAPQEGGDGPVRYPGERVLRTRADNQKFGIPVSGIIWDDVLRL